MERRLVPIPALEAAAAVAKDVTDRGLASDLTLMLDGQEAVLTLKLAAPGRAVPCPRFPPHFRAIWSQFVLDEVEANREQVRAARDHVQTTRAWIEQTRRPSSGDRPAAAASRRLH